MYFRWSTLVVVILAIAFVAEAFYQPVAAYCGMYPLAGVAAVVLVLNARRPGPAPDLSVSTGVQRARRARNLLITSLIVSLTGWVTAVGWGQALSTRVERILAIFIPSSSIFTLLLLLRWMRLREMIPDPHDPRCANCNYSLKGLTEARCPECGQSFSRDRD